MSYWIDFMVNEALNFNYSYTHINEALDVGLKTFIHTHVLRDDTHDGTLHTAHSGNYSWKNLSLVVGRPL